MENLCELLMEEKEIGLVQSVEIEDGLYLYEYPSGRVLIKEIDGYATCDIEVDGIKFFNDIHLPYKDVIRELNRIVKL